MTREEAIHLIENHKYPQASEAWAKLSNEALDMAIESLSAEPKCETCRHNDKEWYSTACDSCCGNNSHYEPSGDLISRADAIDAVRYLIYDRQEKGTKPFKWWFIKQRLNAIPSADRPTEYNLETIADIVRQLGHLDGCIADICLDRPEVNSADEIVRCKDCDKTITPCGDAEIYCYRWRREVGPNDFCSWGERKE